MDNVLTPEDHSYLSTFGGKVLTAVTKIDDGVREMTLEELEEHCKPTYQHYQFKIAFWNEYSTALKERRQFDSTDACNQARCTPMFFNRLLRDPHSAWWLLMPTATYDTQMQALLYKALKVEAQVLDMDVNTATQNTDGSITAGINPKLVELQLRVVKDLKDRVVGSVVKRTEMKASVRSQQQTVFSEGGIDVPAIAGQAVEVNLDNIDDEIKRLKGKV